MKRASTVLLAVTKAIASLRAQALLLGGGPLDGVTPTGAPSEVAGVIVPLSEPWLR